MAQPRVTEFFSARKRTADSQPSKRRKVVILSSSVETLPVQNANIRSTRASSRNKSVIDPVPDQVKFTFNAKSEPLATKTQDKSKSKTKSVRKVRKTNTSASERNQSNIKDAFEKASRANSPTEEIGNSQQGTGEEVTSAWDEHDGVPLTPSKRPKNGDDSSDSERTEATKKRTRRGKSKATVAETKAVTPSKEENEEPARKPKPAKKKLHLRPVIYSSSDEGNSETEVTSEEISDVTLPPKTPPAISPIPDTPEVVRQQLKKGPAKPTSKKVKAAMALVQKLQEDKGTSESKATYKNDLKEAMTSENMKQKLSKIGGLEDLKARLADMAKTKASLKKDVPKLQKFDKVDVEVPSPSKETSKKAPAYERFHALATPAPPTLTMPYKYRLLGDMFRSMDTVVSMLHNRTETCTFSKLKAAVQSMTKRNFEESHVGQVKTVYPTAYTYRQQKGIPDFTSSKPAGYQLTLEANLNEDEDVKQKKVNFAAKDLMDRRCVFQNKLLSIVKRHHKEFLARLDQPLTVPDDKITRWHPKFSVDEVPDIEVSELPKPVVSHKYTTAKDVLEARRGHLPAKVEQALEKVALTSKEEVSKKETVKTDAKSVNATNSSSGSQYKGIPQSLLDKIREKENKKLTLAMTRNPVEDRRMEMLQRLPNLMRMLRSHFVTEKKPALLLENIIQKLGDSSRNFIPYAAMESHVKLMIEVLPKWLTLVEIKKGKYVKMDRNLDLQVLIEEVNNLLKNKS